MTDTHAPEDDQDSPEDRDLSEVADLAGVGATQEELRVSSDMRDYAAEEEADEAEATAKPASGMGRKPLIIAGLAGATLLLLLLVTVALQQERRISVPVSQGGDRIDRISARRMGELDRFKETVVSNINRLNRNVTALGERASLIQGRQDRLVESFEQKLSESLNELTNLANASIENIKQIERQKKALVASDQITARWSKQFVNPNTSLVEGIEAMRQELLDSGLSAREAENQIATVLQESGHVRVANVAEFDMSREEIESLPDWVQPHVVVIRDSIYSRGATAGEVLEHDSHHEIIRRTLRIRAQRDDLDGDLVKRIWQVCRVRREDINERQRTMLPRLLVVQRKTMEDLDPYKIEQLVWSQRPKLGHETTPGQHLALIHIISRTIDNAPGGAASNEFKPLDDQYLSYLKTVVDSALNVSWGMGKRSESALSAAAERAVDNYLVAARVEMPQAQRQAFVMERMASFMQEHTTESESTAAPVVIAGRRPVQAEIEEGEGGFEFDRKLTDTGEVVQDTGRRLVLGPVEIGKEQARRAAWLLTPLILQTYPGDPLTKDNIPATIATWIQAAVISDHSFDALAGQSQSGLKWGRTVIPQAMEAIEAGRTWITFPISIGLPLDDPDFDLIRGVILGGVFAPLMRSTTDPGSASVATASEEAKRQWGDYLPDQALIDRIALARERNPFEVIATVYRHLGFGRTPLQPKMLGFAASLAEAMLDFGLQIATSLPPASSWQSERSVFRANMEEGLRLLVPFSIAAHNDLFTNPEAMIAAVRQDVLAFIVGEVAHDMGMAKLNNSVLPMYMNSVHDRGGGLTRLATYLNEQLPELVRERVAMLPSVDQDRVLLTARSVADEVLPHIERGMVVEVIMSRVEPRIEEKTQLQGKFFRDEVIGKARVHAEELIEEPFTPSRIDEWAIAVTDYANRLIGGEEDVGEAGPAGQISERMPAGRLVFPEVTAGEISLAVKGVGQYGVGGSIAQQHTITVPAGSYGKAHLLSGIDAVIGGSSQGEAVLINLSYTWKGPNSSRLYMRNLRLIGEIEPDVGTERVRVNLRNLSYVFPSGHQVFLPIKGFVVDNAEGLAGIRGEVKLNLSRILPYTTTSSFARGFAETLSQLSTQTTADVGGEVLVEGTVDPADTFQNSLLAGLGQGVSSVDQHLQSIISEFKPSVRVDAGRSLTVVLTEPVPIDVPQHEFKALLSEASRL